MWAIAGNNNLIRSYLAARDKIARQLTHYHLRMVRCANRRWLSRAAWVPALLIVQIISAPTSALAANAQPFGNLGDLVSRHGLWIGVLAVFIGGIALNLTPCVYPMIPVTLAFFSNQASGAVGRAALLAVSYVLGLSLNYALLGFIAAQTGGLFGGWLQQPGVLIAISLIVALLSLSMFGIYELRLPGAITQHLGQASGGVWGAFLMGALVGLIAAPCIGPFVLSLLLLVGKLANPAAGFLLFFALGLGMGFPYMVLGIAAQRIGRLPKAGAWLIWSKKALGVALLGLSVYFVRPLISAQWLRLMIFGLLIAGGAYLGWFERSHARGPVFSWVRRIAGAALLLAGLATVWPASRESVRVPWVPYSEAAFEQAIRDGKPVLVDLYADWCLPCVEMDHVTFHHPDVIRALESVAVLRVDATREVSDEGQMLLKRYKIYGAPTLLFFDRTGKERQELRLLGFAEPQEFLDHLRQIL